MRVYIPFNMIVDTDFGIIRLIEKVQDIPEYPINKLKSFLLKRENENPVLGYNRIRELDLPESTYNVILQKYYKSVLPLSQLTDMVSFVLNTYKLGLYNEVEIIVGCDLDCEVEFLKIITSKLDYNIDIQLNTRLDLNRFDCIFTKYFDEYYVDYLINNLKISGKKIYVADYNFNTLYDDETQQYMIDPLLHMELESKGNIVYLVSLYNKK